MSSRKRKVTCEEIRDVRDVPFGEFVRKVAPSGRIMKTVFQLQDYDRSVKAYWLWNTEDINQSCYLEADRKVLVGFDY